jgi:hypothetical protein
MKISDFRMGLDDLQRAMRKWGATKQSSELASLTEALAEFDDLTFAELVRRIKAINSSPRQIKEGKPLNLAVVERYLATLKSAMHSSDAFNDAVDHIVANKKELPPAELKELARQFGGSVPAKTSRPAIADFLKKRRLDMRRQEGVGATIDRMFGRL